MIPSQATALDAALLRALVAAILIAVPCAVLGVYVVVRRMAFIGDALAHTTLPGLVLAFLFGWSLFAGALVAALVTALGIAWLARRSLLREDTAIGILFTAMFALGILLSSASEDPEELMHMLLGRLLSVSSGALIGTAVVAVVVVVALALFGKEIELASVDPLYAEVIGIPTDRLRLLLLILLALAVVSGIQAVGVILTAALLITPAAAASLVSDRLSVMMTIASIIAVVSSLAGLYVSYRFAVASGAGIVLACTVCFACAWVYRTVRLRAS